MYLLKEDYLAKARLRGSRSDKTESGLLSGLSREASTKRKAVLAGHLNLPITMRLLLISSPLIDNEMRIHA